MKFLIYTRFGLYVRRRSWYEKQLGVIRRYLIPSLENQEYKSFIWILGVDEYCPEDIIVSLKNDISAASIDFRIVTYKRKEIGRFPKIAGTEWLFEEALDKLGRNNFFSSPEEYYISAMIDCDDAWHKSTVGEVHNIMSDQLRLVVGDESNSPYLTSPSGGIVLTFKNGLYFCEDRKLFFQAQKEFSSMSVFVMSKVLSGISCHTARHLQWENFYKVAGFRKISCSTKKPMWIYSTKVKNGVESLSQSFDEISDFGVSFSELTLSYPSMDFDAINAKDLQLDFFIKRCDYLMG